jgi:hypothetical protein
LRRGLWGEDKGIVHIGKEANNLDNESLDGRNVQVFKNLDKERERILLMRQCDAERRGIDRKTRWRMKNTRIDKNK